MPVDNGFFKYPNGKGTEEENEEMMSLHNSLYGDLREEYNYVKRGSIVICTLGVLKTKIDSLLDHGVYTGVDEDPVLTCNDCKAAENIYGFGICRCPKATYQSYSLPAREEVTVKDGSDTKKGEKCVPILDKSWRQQSVSVLTQINEDGSYAPALVQTATLLCKYGGWIEIIEVPKKVNKDYILVDDWLKLYFKPTVEGNGRSVDKPSKANTKDWAMPEEINNYPKGTAATDIKSRGGAIELFQAKNNTYMDSEGRYWVGLGPTVMNPSHSKTARVGVKAAEMKYGTKLDIMVADEDGKIYYIPAVSGDGKEHSFPDGLYQTGVPFDNVGRPIDYKKDDKNNYILDAQGSKIINEQKNMVEFIGKNITKKVYVVDNGPKSSINVTNNYSLIKIIVYDGVVNY